MYNNRKGKGAGLPSIRKSTALARKRSVNEETPLFKKIISSSLLGVGVNALSGIALVSLVCLFAYGSRDPLSLIPTAALLSLLPSNFLGGFVAARRCKEAAIACGITTTAMWGLLSILGAICLYTVAPSGYAVWQSLLLHAASLLFCLLGAAAGGVKRNPTRKKRRFG